MEGNVPVILSSASLPCDPDAEYGKNHNHEFSNLTHYEAPAVCVCVNRCW